MRRILLLVAALGCLLSGSWLLATTGLPQVSTITDFAVRDVVLLGASVPDTTVTLISGTRLRLSELHGSVIILNFWATWCVPCRSEMPELQQIHQRYAGDGLRIIAINQGEDRAAVLDWVQRLQLDYEIGLDATREIGRRLGVAGLPTTYIIDDRGILRQVFYGIADETILLDTVTPLLNGRENG